MPVREKQTPTQRKDRRPRSARRGAAAQKGDAPPENRSFTTWRLGLLGAVLCYLAHPPASLSLLAWIGPVPWLLLIGRQELPGRRPYLVLWACGLVHWLLAVQWLRLPHELNIFALAFVASYLGFYLPVFVGLARIATHRLGMPLWLGGPVVWTGLEWLRARLLTGFLMASLAHTQIRWTPVIQIADVLGEYGVTFLIVLVAASIATALSPLWRRADAADLRAQRRPSIAWRKLTPGGAAVAATLAYGGWRMSAAVATDNESTFRVALIQSDMQADWKGTDERDHRVMQQQADLSGEALRESDRPIDLIVWPETMFRYRLHTRDAEYAPPPGFFQPSADEFFSVTTSLLNDLACEFDAAILVGIDRTHWREPTAARQIIGEDGKPYYADSFNSSVLVDRDGQIVGTYDKMHLLPFGEYIPLVQWAPMLSALTPITGGATPGRTPDPLTLGNQALAVNICYESALPHLIRRQMRGFSDNGRLVPQLMVNLTNDAWYWGSSELDMHLACGVFRAVEMRTPMVVAANRGLSAHIDRLGNIRQVSQRDQAATLLCDVELRDAPPHYPTLYGAYGDWFALSCLVCCMVLAIVGWRDRKRDPPEASGAAERSSD